MNLSIEKIDKKGALSVETIELAFRRCTGAVEDKFYKALSKLSNSNLQMKVFAVLAKYIDEEAEDKESEYQNAIIKAMRAGDLNIDEVSELSNKSVNYDEKTANRRAKIEALQACALVDTKHMKDFESKPESEFWQAVTSEDIDAAINFFRTRNKI